MKSGLEDRNNLLRDGTDPLNVWVSMKSGLEDRNNNSDKAEIPFLIHESQ